MTHWSEVVDVVDVEDEVVDVVVDLLVDVVEEEVVGADVVGNAVVVEGLEDTVVVLVTSFVAVVEADDVTAALAADDVEIADVPDDVPMLVPVAVAVEVLDVLETIGNDIVCDPDFVVIVSVPIADVAAVDVSVADITICGEVAGPIILVVTAAVDVSAPDVGLMPVVKPIAFVNVWPAVVPAAVVVLVGVVVITAGGVPYPVFPDICGEWTVTVAYVPPLTHILPPSGDAPEQLPVQQLSPSFLPNPGEPVHF
jgi:hypothetical protein